MYGWLWRHLPGPTSVRLLLLLVMAFGVLAVCYVWFFPWLAPHMPFNGITVGE